MGVFSVLVVDDDWFDLMAAERCLDGINDSMVLLPVFVASGEAAIRLAESGYVPDLLLIDQNLRGGRSGLEVIAALREVIGTSVPAALVSGASVLASLEVPPSVKCLTKPLFQGEAYIRAWIRGMDLEKAARAMPSLSVV